jgi:hypothetical protein
MANATDIVKKGSVRRTDEFIKRSLDTLASETRFYTNAHLGTKPGTGYLAKFDDTQVLHYAGQVRGDEGNPLFDAGTGGATALEIDEQQPFRFELAVGSVAVTDVGRLVYALDDQTGTLDASATVYGNVYGVVVERVASGIALVEPLTYAAPKGGHLQVAAADGAIAIKHGATVVITKGSAAALTIADPATADNGCRMTIISTTAFAHTVTRTTTGFNNAGASGDVATFGAAAGNGMTIVAYGAKWYVENTLGVTLA